jgi:hypothetical protein
MKRCNCPVCHVMRFAVRLVTGSVIAAAFYLSFFVLEAKPATVPCQVPVLSPDGVDLPDGDPCLGPTITAEGRWLVGLNDNAARPDHDFNDIMFALDFRPADGGVIGHYIYLGAATAHDVRAEIAGALYGAADATLGWFARGVVVPVFVRDFTEGERLDASNPLNGWAHQEVPEPHTASMLVIALGGLVLWGTWRSKRG